MEVMLQSDSQLPHLQQPKLNQLQQRPQQQEAAGERINNQEKGDKHLHVLAVDDSLIDRKILEQLLTVSSYHVTCVDSGDKALEFLGLVDNPSHSSSSSSSSSPSHQEGKGMQVNLIMTDFSMPGMSGYDLLKRVKGSNSWKDVPVVVMSSENVPSRIHMCLEEGAEEFLLKPVRLSDLEKLQPRISKCSGCLCGESTNSSSTAADQANANVVVKKEVVTNSIEDNGTSKLQGNRIISPDSTETNDPQEEQRPTSSVLTTAIEEEEEEDMIVSPTSTTTTTLLNKRLDHFS